MMPAAVHEEVSPEAPESMLTAEAVAERLNFGLTYTKRLIGEGVIPSVKVGRLRRVRESDLVAYIRALPVAPPTRTA